MPLESYGYGMVKVMPVTFEGSMQYGITVTYQMELQSIPTFMVFLTAHVITPFMSLTMY